MFSGTSGHFVGFPPLPDPWDRPQYVFIPVPVPYGGPTYGPVAGHLAGPPPTYPAPHHRYAAPTHSHRRDSTQALHASRRFSADFQPREPGPPSPKGPPRRPKQSGHCMWVGNLSPKTTVIDLKDYFSTGAEHDIESVFFIAKSNCAFVNYISDAACRSAVARFGDTELLGHRLPCKLRSSSVSTASTSPPESPDEALNKSATGAQDGQVSFSPPPTPPDTPIIVYGSCASSQGSAQPAAVKAVDGADKVDRFFIMKSLTTQDLVESVASRSWQTQAHNEKALNAAFAAAANVYLIFSANRSGEFFGFARLASLGYAGPDKDRPAVVESGSRPRRRSSSPHLVPTTATSTAPAGWVYDDHVRGTVFWEAAGTIDAVASPCDYDGSDAPHKQFDVEWLSTLRLPFHRTRGIRNSWNESREVKVARDGTEIETAAGKRLLRLFNRANWNVDDAAPSPSDFHASSGSLLTD